VGSQTGVLNIFTYGDWGDISDRFPGHPESVDALVKCDEDIVFTGTFAAPPKPTVWRPKASSARLVV
jgi:hypothetical protein